MRGGGGGGGEEALAGDEKYKYCFNRSVYILKTFSKLTTPFQHPSMLPEIHEHGYMRR